MISPGTDRHLHRESAARQRGRRARADAPLHRPLCRRPRPSSTGWCAATASPPCSGRTRIGLGRPRHHPWARALHRRALVAALVVAARHRDHGRHRHPRSRAARPRSPATATRWKTSASTAAPGVNIGIGTDTVPQNMIEEMRWATVLARIAARTSAPPRWPTSSTPPPSAAPHALLRDDLGRLAPGARADLVLVD